MLTQRLCGVGLGAAETKNRRYHPIMLSEPEAIAAVRSAWGELTHGGLLPGMEQRERVWLVTLVGADGSPAAGGPWLVGPDGKVFIMASDRGPDDWPGAVRLLDRMYAAGSGGAVAPSGFVGLLRVGGHGAARGTGDESPP